jgi:hypothetical protein
MGIMASHHDNSFSIMIASHLKTGVEPSPVTSVYEIYPNGQCP